jgi:DHA3 family macrolide efflux protein-like MFS transporter
MSEMAISRGERWRDTLSILADRNFLFLWLSGGLVGLGGATLNIALMKLIYDQTGSAGGVGLLLFTNIFSMVIITPISGVLADRLDRKKLMVTIGVLRTVLVFLFLWADTPLAIYVINFFLAVVSTLNFPVRAAVMPDIVEREHLLDANAVDRSLATLVLIVGPLLGGIMVDQASLEFVFVLNGALCLAGVLALLLIQVPPPSLLRGEASLRAVYQEFVEGARYARVNPVVSALTIIYFVFLAGLSLRLSLDLVFAEQVLSHDSLPAATAYSYMMSAASVGMFLGSLLISYLGRRYPRKRLLLVGLGVRAVDAIGLAFVRSLPFALALRFVHGIGGGLSEALWPTLLQENVEEDKLGRAFSLFVGVVTIPPAITVYLGGWLADQSSLQIVYGIAGGWALLAVIGSRFLSGYQTMPTWSEDETMWG